VDLLADLAATNIIINDNRQKLKITTKIAVHSVRSGKATSFINMAD